MNPEELLLAKEEALMLREARSERLHFREEEVIEMWLDGATMEEAGAVIGKSRERVRTLRASAIIKLHKMVLRYNGKSEARYWYRETRMQSALMAVEVTDADVR